MFRFWIVFFLAPLYLAAAEPICSDKKIFSNSIQEISQALANQTSYIRDCVRFEVLDPLLDPYRTQSLALAMCQKSEVCLQFLRDEVTRVSGFERPIDIKQPAVALWAEILQQSGRTRRPPTQLKDLPLEQDPEALFRSLKEESRKDSKFDKNEQLKVVCAAFVALLGPGKVKAYGAVKAATSVKKIERTHDVEKLISKNRLPAQVKEKFLKWSQEVETKGLNEVKKQPGYHDEPLAGHAGWHSVRLSDGFRACYKVIVKSGVELIEVFAITNDHKLKSYCRM